MSSLIPLRLFPIYVWAWGDLLLGIIVGREGGGVKLIQPNAESLSAPSRPLLSQWHPRQPHATPQLVQTHTQSK